VATDDEGDDMPLAISVTDLRKTFGRTVALAGVRSPAPQRSV
jgi:hypothetical protein